MAARSANAYIATLNRLEPLVEEAEHVVPGHGAPMDGTRAAAILREDRTYLEALLADGEKAKLPIARNNGGQRRSTRRTCAPRVSLHDRDERLEQTFSPPRASGSRPTGRARAHPAARGVCSRHQRHGARPRARRRAAPRHATAVGDPDRPSALPRVHPGRAGAGLRARRRAAGRELDLRRVVARGLGRRARRERGAELARTARGAARRRRRLLRPGRHQRQPVGEARGRSQQPGRPVRATRVACSADVRSSVGRCCGDDAEPSTSPAAGSPAPRCARRLTATATACSPSSPPPAPPTSG